MGTTDVQSFLNEEPSSARGGAPKVGGPPGVGRGMPPQRMPMIRPGGPMARSVGPSPSNAGMIRPGGPRPRMFTASPR